jgi:hypothetical protein
MADATRSRKPLSAAVIVFYAIAAVVTVSGSETVRTWIVSNWIPLGVAGAIGLGGLIWAFWRGEGKAAAAQSWRIGFILFLGLPLVAGLVAAVLSLPEKYHQSVLRGVFLVAVIFLPAILYYLFVALRRVSLLQEYFTNLLQLGLLECQPAGSGTPAESERDRKIRVMTYLQMFEGIYGAIPSALAGDIVRQTDQTRQERRIPNFHKYESSLLTPEAIPVVVATVVIALGWLLVLPPWDFNVLSAANKPLDLGKVLAPTLDPVLFAFLGAYFYALQMLFRRFVRRDLRANAYVGISLRVILSVVGVWAVLQVAAASGDIIKFGAEAAGKTPPADAGKAGLLAIGFVVGAFPPIAWQVLMAYFRAATRARIFVPSLNSPMPLRHLDGLTVWHEGRLEEEDIENVQNMATASLVELFLNTRYPPNRIVDWVDQAMLYTQLGQEPSEDAAAGANDAGKTGSAIKILRGYGIRTASSLLAAYEESKMRSQQTEFESILLDDKNKSRIPIIVDALRSNPNLALVQRWNQTAKAAGGAAAQPPTPAPKPKPKSNKQVD